MEDEKIDEDHWWETFSDDPCDDISGQYLHLWFAYRSMQVS
jgi:hypothetical protein